MHRCQSPCKTTRLFCLFPIVLAGGSINDGTTGRGFSHSRFSAMKLLISQLLALMVSLLFTQSSWATDISKCSSVSNGQARIIGIKAKLDNLKTVSVSGILLKPSGQGPFPIVLMLPGTGGMLTPYCHGVLADQFARWGYATLIVASTTAHDDTGRRLYEFSFADQANHARGAVETLATFTDIDRNRIAVWGFSRGGMTAIELATNSQDHGRWFRAIVAAAPPCPAKFVIPRTPLLVMIGTDDERLSAQACKDFAAKLGAKNQFEFLLLQGAKHVFWMNPKAAEQSALKMREFLQKHL